MNNEQASVWFICFAAPAVTVRLGKPSTKPKKGSKLRILAEQGGLGADWDQREKRRKFIRKCLAQISKKKDANYYNSPSH